MSGTAAPPTPATLIHGAVVVTMDAAGTVLTGDVLVRDGRIDAVGDISSASDAEVVDARGRILIPGLVNAHVHLWQAAFRGIGVDWSGTELHLRTQSGLATGIGADALARSVRLGALSLLDAGVTTAMDYCHGGTAAEHAHAGFEALAMSGIRAVFAKADAKTQPVHAGAGPHFSELPYSGALADAMGALHDPGGLVEPALALLGPSYTDEGLTVADLRAAADRGLRSFSHVNAPRAVPGGYAALVRAGAELERHNVAHATRIDDDDLSILLDAGATVTSTPASETRESFVEPAMLRVERLGGEASLGTSSMIAHPADLFSAMQLALHLGRMFRARHDDGAPPRLPAPGRPIGEVPLDTPLPPRLRPASRDVLRWATIGGARALGLGDVTGSIEVGKAADLVLLDTRDVSFAPAHAPVDAVVGVGSRTAVSDVWVAGRSVKRDGTLTGAADLPGLIERCRRDAHALARALDVDLAADPFVPRLV